MHASRPVAALVPAALLAVAFACTGDSPTEPGSEPREPAKPGAVRGVAGDAQTGTVGARLAEPLVVEVTDRNGAVLAGVEVAWEVVTGGGGFETSRTRTGDDGRASVRWTLGTKAGPNEARVTVADLPPVIFEATGEPGPPAALEVEPAAAGLTALADTIRLRASAADAYGNPVPEAAIAWLSLDTVVATVDTAGLVTALGPGTARIAANAVEGEAGDTVRVDVAPRAGTVSVSPALVTLTAVGDTVRLTARAVDANGYPIDAPDLSWSSTDEAVATVSADGLVTAVGDGAAAASASVDGTTASIDVRVSTSSGVVREWVAGDGGASAWSDPLNWAPAGGPNGADTLRIPAAAAAAPALVADAAAGRVEVEDGARLDIGPHTLSVAGGVEALGPITGTGTLVLTGADATLRGTVPGLRIEGDVSLSGETIVNGEARLTGGTLRFAGQPFRIRRR